MVIWPLSRLRRSKMPRKLAEGVAQAAQDSYLRQPGAAATRDLAEAARIASEAIGDHEGCHLYDNLLVLKWRDAGGELHPITKELTTEERRALRSELRLFEDPGRLVQRLATAVERTLE